MKVWGVSVSYYTGKLETYLRYKGIDYTMASPFARAKEILPHTGAIQVPMVERDDGRWMSDSTPIIAHLEKEYPGRPVMPANPVVRFIALFIEDYADEWLWRAAMHYRWSYDYGRALLGRILADEVATGVSLPRFLKIRTVIKRQHTSFVVSDGVTGETWDHVESGYYNALRHMTTMLANRPYLLGQTPSIADFGFMGPMLRHFAQDPTPQEIMRNEGPAVYEWVGWMWNAGSTCGDSYLLDEVPEDAADLLKEASETHLKQLTENAKAYANGQKRFDMVVQGCQYRDLPVSRYRVWCLEQLRRAFRALSAAEQASVRALLDYPDASVLWHEDELANSDYDTAGEAPFNKAINVFGKGTPD